MNPNTNDRPESSNPDTNNQPEIVYYQEEPILPQKEPKTRSLNPKNILIAVAVVLIVVGGGLFASSRPPAPTEIAAKPKPYPAITPSDTGGNSGNVNNPTKTSEKPITTGYSISLEKLAGEYKVILDPKLLADAEKEGVKSVTGKWTIKSDGNFIAILKAVSTQNEVQEIKTTGKIKLEGGKIISQVESVNGEKPSEIPPPQPYTISTDGRELQADGQPVKLIKQ
jgi:hypothetical protein